MHTNIHENFHLLHRSVRHTPVNLHSTLETLTRMLQNHRAHESAIRIGVKYKETEELDDHLLKGIQILSMEKNNQFGADGGNEECDIEISAELELEDIGNMYI